MHGSLFSFSFLSFATWLSATTKIMCRFKSISFRISYSKSPTSHCIFHEPATRPFLAGACIQILSFPNYHSLSHVLLNKRKKRNRKKKKCQRAGEGQNVGLITGFSRYYHGTDSASGRHRGEFRCPQFQWNRIHRHRCHWHLTRYVFYGGQDLYESYPDSLAWMG